MQPLALSSCERYEIAPLLNIIIQSARHGISRKHEKHRVQRETFLQIGIVESEPGRLRRGRDFPLTHTILQTYYKLQITYHIALALHLAVSWGWWWADEKTDDCLSTRFKGDAEGSQI